jgi:iron(III) transport system ATP-binding protein
MTELTVQNVHKFLGGLHILQGASFTAERGSIVSLLGASGSGKTTLLRCIAGLEQPEQGRISIAGKPRARWSHRSDCRPRKPQYRTGVPVLLRSGRTRTVMENVAYGLKLRGVGKVEAGKRVQATLEKIGLGHLAERFPDQLSGGQQQRVAICRALVSMNPARAADGRAPVQPGRQTTGRSPLLDPQAHP